MMMEEDSLKQLTRDVHTALKNWDNIGEENAILLDTLLLVHMQRKQMGISNPASLRLATNRVLMAGIKAVAEQDAQAAAILEKRFVEKQKLRDLSFQFKINEDKLKRLQRAAIVTLASTLYEQEEKVRAEQVVQLESGLESPSYTTLFGVETLAANLLGCLSDTQAHEIVMLTGIGGIGKTALANYVVRQVIRQFYYESVVWISVSNEQAGKEADPEVRFQRLMHQLGSKLLPHLSASTHPMQRMAQLRQLLKRTPYLVVVDNLEQLSDMSYLLANLVELTTPGKFLLTSRTQPAGQSGVRHVVMPELERAPSLALIRHHAEDVSLPDLAEADDAALAPIYDTVGGNPFALKLVVGLARTRTLPDLLSEMQAAPAAVDEELYEKIFWQAWHTLSEPARTVWCVMPLAPEEGLLPDRLLTLSGLSKEALWPAVNELAARSLIEVKGTVWERRYGIHQLTKTFIESQLLGK